MSELLKHECNGGHLRCAAVEGGECADPQRPLKAYEAVRVRYQLEALRRKLETERKTLDAREARADFWTGLAETVGSFALMAVLFGGTLGFYGGFDWVGDAVTALDTQRAEQRAEGFANGAETERACKHKDTPLSRWPEVGSVVERGWRFKGGEPGCPSSWERAR